MFTLTLSLVISCLCLLQFGDCAKINVKIGKSAPQTID